MNNPCCPQIPAFILEGLFRLTLAGPYLIAVVVVAAAGYGLYLKCCEYDRQCAKWAAIEYEHREDVRTSGLRKGLAKK